jgi:molybdopterin biosynthesis enzyme
LAEDAEDENHNVVLKAGEMINKSALSLLESSNVSMVRVRSPLTCHCVS